MPLWVTMKNGEVRRYDRGVAYRSEGGWLKIASSAYNLDNHHPIAELRIDGVGQIAFEQPCEVTFTADAIESALDVLLRRARGICGDYSAARKLADLKRLLRGFNPQRRQWSNQ